ncbi:alpha/beta fold hydrolase [Paenarthrobacter aurescens]|uniref:Esterase n=1 Tax=Paenarthrobacter aurescens TaxID=43663 RepID=A0A4Y3NF82_PAEAU|nr:alpha/beta hydrolase [Paenarthrobacter aurescens]MDO6144969.1 alpha/beta hydrolase [Paenarthrobacter aurescens]MDO6148814.1 alpha/beta hydrolase [Paenarthrobacter aurescens]MDO6160060.1 alpha/beta hydrolase [Paenarthrobacter aurescens]MDO6163919.1 alpha/beta hydrolase [Paenarthrobacter aurescens]GEB17369.1 esterase [Paenarthrobacter aurescens]
MTTTTSSQPIILIAGHWLGAWAWDEVLEHLETDHSRAVAVTLPGLDRDDPERATKTLDDQAAAVLDIFARHGVSDEQPATIVAHSGANAPVSLVLDRHPELVDQVVWVDSGPVAAGSVFAPDLPEGVEELPLPSLDVLAQQASLEGLSAEVLERFRARAVPEPGPVLRQPVELTNDARRKVRTTLVCCSIPGTQLLELAHAGHAMFAEVANIEHLEVIDLPTGHWPMWSRPGDLAKVIQSASSRAI